MCIIDWVGCWADLVCGIGFAAQFGCGMHVSKVDSLDFDISCFHDILLMVSDSLMLYFDINLMYMAPYGCIRMLMEVVFIDFHWFSLISGGFEGLGGWGDAWTLPIDARTCMFIDSYWFSLVFIDFRRI